MKRIAVVTFAKEVAVFYRDHIQKLFGPLEIQAYSFEEGQVEKPFREELIVIATYAIYDLIRPLIDPASEVVVANVTLSRDGMEKLRQIPEGSKVMLVNLSPEMCLEAMSLIYRLGLQHIEMVPVYPGMTEVPRLEIAVTPGERRYVPAHAKEIIDIGHRCPNAATMAEIALKLGKEAMLQEAACREYFASIVDNHYTIDVLSRRSRTLENQFEILLRVLEEGIIGMGPTGLVFAYNDSAQEILGLRRESVIGRLILDCCPAIPFADMRETGEAVKTRLVQWQGVHLYVEVVPVHEGKQLVGAFAIVKKFTDMERQQHQLRLQLVQKGYRARYVFDDIVGCSSVMMAAKEMAGKMAKTDLTVLITGESGTGKELFAQAMHNESERKGYPFVAINCAAIPEQLLESELFGYEEGSFTGARKGGKRGVFEFAHQGTLFLDEIGEMSLMLQAKLLRIIQEKEVVRIGGDRVIKVDVRIVAATNEDLWKRVEQGRFRRDLYYRISVLPLVLPPLRSRGHDILLLAERFLREMDSREKLPAPLKESFLRHTWEGNVRELRNYIERLVHIGFHEELFAPLLLPKRVVAEQGKEAQSEAFLMEQIMKALEEGQERVEGLGRRRLTELLQERGMVIREQEVRSLLHKLAEKGWVTIGRGRSGCWITSLGLKRSENKSG